MPHILRHTLGVILAVAVLLAAAPHAYAQDTAVLPAEYNPASALGPDTDPNAAAIEDALADWGEESAEGTFTATDPNQLAAVAMPELDDSTRASGILVDEHGELPAFHVGDPAFGSSYLFLPAVGRGSAGLPDTTAESTSGALVAGTADEFSAGSGGAGLAGGAGEQGATGDFNGDGYADLAIAAPQESLTAGSTELGLAGAVTVLYGSPGGLSAAGSQVWTQNSAGVPDTAEPNDVFGCALAAGDFDGDSHADLAIGVCGESFSSTGAPSHLVTEGGAVQVLYGSPAGLTAARSQFWTQDSAGVRDVAEEEDHFGSALAAGDFDGDGRADLAVGVPFEDIAGRIDTGMVQVLYGAAPGLAALPDTQRTQIWHQSVAGIPDLAEIGDGFGGTLATGDFDADGNADLAVSAPYEDLGADANQVVDAGVVHVIRGSAGGLTAAGAQRFSEDTVGIRGFAEARDFFGWSLVAGDFDGTGAADLAIGIPMEDFSLESTSLTNAGAVAVVYSSGPAGLTAPSSRIVTQSVAGMLGEGMADSAETGDTFGHALGAAQVAGSPAAALVVGIPSEDLGAIPNAGAVHVVYGPLPPGQDAVGGANTLWTQDSAGVLDAAETADGFGLTVAGDDFDGSGATDLVFGVPREDLGGIRDAGAVNVLANPLGALSHGYWAEDVGGIPGLAEPGDLFGQLGQ
jgi:hypothetical protein